MNPSSATPMEKVCGPQRRLCRKIIHIWSNLTVASAHLFIALFTTRIAFCFFHYHAVIMSFKKTEIGLLIVDRDSKYNIWVSHDKVYVILSIMLDTTMRGVLSYPFPNQ